MLIFSFSKSLYNLNLNWNTLCPIDSFNWNSWNTLVLCKYPEFTSQFYSKLPQQAILHCVEGKRGSIVLQIVGNESNFRAKSFPCNVNTGCLFAKGGAACCGNAHFFFQTKNKYLSAIQSRTMQTWKIAPKKAFGDDEVQLPMRPQNQNLFVEKVDWNMKCERRDNLWVIRNCPSAGRQKLLVIFFFLCARPLMKTDRKLNGSDKNCSLSAFCFRSHPSAPVWAEIWTRRSVGSCGHLLITAVWCLDSDHLGHCWNLTCNGKICSLY